MISRIASLLLPRRQRCVSSQPPEHRGALARLPQEGRLRVLRGTAWLSSSSGDLLLQPGDGVRCAQLPLDTLIGAVGDSPLEYSILLAEESNEC